MALGYRFMIVGILFALTGMSLGIWMGTNGPDTFIFAPVHAHINLVGWASHFLYGLYYRGEPVNSRGVLPQIHFWCAVLGGIILAAGILFAVAAESSMQTLFGLPTGKLAALTAPGSILTILGMLLFLGIVIRGAGRRE
jgi:hypothetical protein